MDSRTPLGLLIAAVLWLASPILGWVLVTLALLAPGLLEPVHRVWRASSNTWALRGYFTLFLIPLAWLQRRWGHDPLERTLRPGSDSYARKVNARPPQHLRKTW